MHYVYIIQSQRDKTVYIGYTKDLKKRLKYHNSGKTKSIKSKIPYKLVYYESYLSDTDARKREIQLKKHGQSKELLLKQINNSLEN
jgi:putative endonuclease